MIAPDAELTPVEATVLRPVEQYDLGWIYQAEFGSIAFQTSKVWNGFTPAPPQFEADYWANALCAYVATDHSGNPVGLLEIRDADFRNRTGDLRFMLLGEPPNVAFSDALRAFVGFVRRAWAFEILYVQSTHSLPALQAAVLALELVPEGAIREHVFDDGEYVDVNVFHIAMPERVGDGG